MKSIDASECYQFIHSASNIKNFLAKFDSSASYYPRPPQRLIQSVLKDSNNWEEDQQHSENTKFQIYQRELSNPSLCEIAHRLVAQANSCIILEHYALSGLPEPIPVTVDSRHIEITLLAKEKKAIRAWFAQYRQPARRFNPSDKHGEKRQKIHHTGDGDPISPLRCSPEHAQALLNTALGSSHKELFNKDTQDGQDYFIVFKWEGDTPQNQYHGYHVPTDDPSIPKEIRNQLLT